MRRNLTGRVFVLLMAVLSVLTPVSAMAQAGLQGDDAYVSPQFGYTVTWGEDWAARERDVISNPGGYDTLRLRSDDGDLLIQGQGDSESAAAAVQRRVTIEGDDDDIVTQDLGSAVPMTEMVVGRNKVLIEGYTLEGTDAVVVIVLSARERDFDAVLASIHEQVLFNDGPILTGEDVVETPESGEAPVDLTDEPQEEETAGETPAAPATAAAPAAAEPSDEAEEDATVAEESPAQDEDAAPAASSVEGGVFQSSLYDYTVTFDESIWGLEEETLNDSSDGIVLSGELGSLTIWSWDAYGADAAACLAGESEYYSNDDPSVEDWAPAEDARGNPIQGEGDGFAWGVYTLRYVAEDGEEIEFVDYIECREIPGDDAVVIIFASATPDVYNDHLEQVLDVADAIEIEGETFGGGSTGSEDPVETVEPDETVEPEETESGLSGSLFTSPSFGFTVEIPAQWSILDEQLADGDEMVMLSNGQSDVVLWATTSYQGDLAGCVDFAAAESGLELELDVDAEGEPFRAEGRREAYAHYRHVGEDGEEMMFFVSCQHIVEGESVFILTQDVPYEDFASQRKFRAELQDAIVMP